MKESRAEAKKHVIHRHWLIWLGVVVTTLWLGSGVVYIGLFGGWHTLFGDGSDGIGGFLEGFFAPLAFLWLVIGLFVQQRELASNTEVLRRTNVNSEKQTEVLAATELRARQSAFFQIAENVRRQSGNLAGIIISSLRNKNGQQLFSDEEMVQHWIDHQHGQYERFTALLSLPDERFVKEGLEYAEIFFGTKERQEYSAEYIKSFRGLIQIARDCDEEGTIVRTITQTPHGHVYGSMINHITPPVCWVLLDEAAFYSSQTGKGKMSLNGTWRITAHTLLGEEEWFATFREISNGDLEGQVHLDETEIEIRDIVTQGTRLYGKIQMPEYLFILTAITDSSSRMRGHLDTREGIYATLEGTRV